MKSLLAAIHKSINCRRGSVTFGINNCMSYVELKGVKTLYVAKCMKYMRCGIPSYLSKESTKNRPKRDVFYCTREELESSKYTDLFRKKARKSDLVNYLKQNYRRFGIKELHIVNGDEDSETELFQKYGGIAAILYYEVDMDMISECLNNDQEQKRDFYKKSMRKEEKEKKKLEEEKAGAMKKKRRLDPGIKRKIRKEKEKKKQRARKHKMKKKWSKSKGKGEQ